MINTKFKMAISGWRKARGQGSREITCVEQGFAGVHYVLITKIQCYGYISDNMLKL